MDPFSIRAGEHALTEIVPALLDAIRRCRGVYPDSLSICALLNRMEAILKAGFAVAAADIEAGLRPANDTALMRPAWDAAYDAFLLVRMPAPSPETLWRVEVFIEVTLLGTHLVARHDRLLAVG